MPQDVPSTQISSEDVRGGFAGAIAEAVNPPRSAYSAALEFLYARINYERLRYAPYSTNHYRLDRMRRLLELIDNPHRKYAVVHVAGTKGKGTVSKLISDGLRACGFRTGLYTSPHLERLEERFQFAGQNANASQFVDLVQRVRSAADQLECEQGGRATFFELTTAMAMLFFADQTAECVVLEVGLGGRLDSTNVCSPIVSVITSISLDHQRQLGDSLTEIAREKAGIIKANIPVVSSARESDARHVFIKLAESLDAPLHLVGRDFSVSWKRVADQGDCGRNSVAEVEYRPCEENESSLGRSTWPTCMLGSYQADNIAAALATLDVMAKQGWDLSQAKLRSAFASSAPQARMQVVDSNPIRIVDTAHNGASIAAGLKALQEHFAERTVNVLFASSRDKNYHEMLDQLVPQCRRMVVTAYKNNPRALPAADVADAARAVARRNNCCCDVHVAESPAAGWGLACRLTGQNELLYATGSFFLAAELLESIAKGDS